MQSLESAYERDMLFVILNQHYLVQCKQFLFSSVFLKIPWFHFTLEYNSNILGRVLERTGQIAKAANAEEKFDACYMCCIGSVVNKYVETPKR